MSGNQSDQKKDGCCGSRKKLGSGMYEVSRIVGMKEEDGEIMYKVRWKGFPKSKDTWEPSCHLNDQCMDLVAEFNESRKTDNQQADISSSSTASTSKISGEKKSSKEVRWEYEVVELMTPEQWNPNGNLGIRELGNLYIQDHIPTETEKLLSSLQPNSSRLTRRKLQALMKDDSHIGAQSTNDQAQLSVKKSHERKRQVQNRTSSSQDIEKTECDATEPEEALGILIVCNESVSTDDLSLDKIASTSAAAVKSGPCRKRGRPKNINLEDTSAKSQGETANASLTSQGKEDTKESKKRTSNKIAKRKNDQEVEGKKAKRIRKTMKDSSVFTDSENSQTNRGQRKQTSKENATSKAESFAGKESVDIKLPHFSIPNQSLPTSFKIPCKRIPKIETSIDSQATSHFNLDHGIVNSKESSSAAFDVTLDRVFDGKSKTNVASDVLLSETMELPLPFSTETVESIKISTLRRQHMSREKPLDTFEAFRNAALSGRLSSIRWTGRCVQSRRGFDFNEFYGGKTVLISLCEKPCDGSHGVDDMVRQLVQDGSHLQSVDKMRERSPLHFAISADLWCRVRTLLSLRAPVNMRDGAGKTPLSLLLNSRGLHYQVLKTMFLLLEYGADVSEILKRKKHYPVSANRYFEKLDAYHRKIVEYFDDARMKVLIDMSVRRTLTPVIVRSIWESESTDSVTEISFNYEATTLTNERYLYIVVLAVFDYKSANNWKVRIWGKSPFESVTVNDSRVQSLQGNPNGFIYATRVINGWNKLKIKYHPFALKKKYLLMAQILLMQLHRQINLS